MLNTSHSCEPKGRNSVAKSKSYSTSPEEQFFDPFLDPDEDLIFLFSTNFCWEDHNC